MCRREWERGAPVEQRDGKLDNGLGLRTKSTEPERLHSHAQALGRSAGNLRLLCAATLDELISDMLASLCLNHELGKLLSIGLALGLTERLVDHLGHHRRCRDATHQVS